MLIIVSAPQGFPSHLGHHRALNRVPCVIQWTTYSALYRGFSLVTYFIALNILNMHWKDWCWSWSSNTLATRCKELTHWKRSWRWERLRAEEGDDRRWDGWWHHRLNGHVFEQTRGDDGQGSLACCMLSMRLQRVGHDCVTELNWTERKLKLTSKYRP